MPQDYIGGTCQTCRERAAKIREKKRLEKTKCCTIKEDSNKCTKSQKKMWQQIL